MKKSWFSILILSIFLIACNCSDTKAPLTKERDGLFVHISSGYDNPKKVLMALTLANKFANDTDVCLFFDIEGVKLLTQVSEDISMEHYQSMQKSLGELIDKGAVVMACPMCLKAANIEPADLLKGVIVAEKEKFFGFTKGRIITLDS